VDDFDAQLGAYVDERMAPIVEGYNAGCVRPSAAIGAG